MNRFFQYFERLIDPFPLPENIHPPASGLGFVWFYARQLKSLFVVMLVFSFLQAIIEVTLFSFVGQLVDLLDEVPRGGLFAEHWPIFAWMIFLILVLRVIVVFSIVVIEEQIAVPGFFTLLRWQTHARIARQDLAFFEDEFAGRIVNKVWQTGHAVGDFMISLVRVIWFIVMYAITTAVILATLDWRLALLVVVWLVIFFAIARLIIPRIRARAKDTAEAGASVSGRMVDAYANTMTLKLFGGREDKDDFIRAGFEGFHKSLHMFTRSLSVMRISQSLVSSVMIVLIAALSIYLYVGSVISAGSVAVVLALVLRLNLLLGRLLDQLNGLFRNLGTAQNSAELIARDIHVVDAPGAKILPRAEGLIEFVKVSHNYDNSGTVIDDMSLTIRPGEKVGIVGRSGAGKTTLMKLVLRLYNLNGGKILLDGQDISTVTQRSLRENFGVVTQDSALLHRSVRDNIAFGSDNISDADIVHAAKRASAHEFILELEDSKGRKGYDAHVGERGVKLSGGQRQRIAIARVFLKDAPILVLDEATSALDSEVEAAIQENLLQLMQGKTVIAIAHRLSTIAALDRLIVLEAGKIVEDGNHGELVEAGELYSQLWKRQSGGFFTPPAKVQNSL